MEFKNIMESGKKYIHITNGECFNKYFEEKYSEEGVPFNEAIMQGKVSSNLFDENFCEFRAKQLNVSKEYYYQNLSLFLNEIKNINKYDKVVLWFGDDCFCQINLLTILACLEQNNYKGKVYSVLIDDETFYVKRPVREIKIGKYLEIYNSVLLNGLNVIIKNDKIMTRAIQLYYDYNNSCGKIAMMIKSNKDKNVEQIIHIVLEHSKEYGITDNMIKTLINKYN